LLLRNNQAVPLAPKAFDTLLLLIENSGHLLDQKRIDEAPMAGDVRREVNLAQNISAIRRALDDKSGGAQYIETVAKVGYRFTVEKRKDRRRAKIDGSRAQADADRKIECENGAPRPLPPRHRHIGGAAFWALPP